MRGMPKGDDPHPGDSGYYTPWGNLVFYYGDVSYFDGIARICRFHSPSNVLRQQDENFTAKIELANCPPWTRSRHLREQHDTPRRADACWYRW